jgi:hypothetical protein
MRSILTIILSPIIAFITTAFMDEPTDKYFEVNLIKNPGAEAETINQNIPYWTPSKEMPEGTLTHGIYGEIEGEWKRNCNKKCGLPANAGKSYFRLPLNEDNSSIALIQEIDLNSIKEIISDRRISIKIEGYVAGQTCGNKNCVVGSIEESFYDKENKLVDGVYSSSLDISKIISFKKGRNVMYEFKNIGSSSGLPKEAVKVVIKIKGKKEKCCEKAAIFFDNLSFVLSQGALRS